MRNHASLVWLAVLALGASGCTLLFPVDEYGASSGYRDAVMDDDPVLYLRFGEATGSVARDVVQQQNATYGSGVVLGAAGAIDGDADTAVTFDGELDAHVEMPPGFDFAGTAPFSIEVWARQSAYQRFGWAIDHQEYGNRNGWGLRFSSPTNGNVAFERYANNDYAGPNVTSSAALSLGTYHHVVATFDGSRLALYIDGALAEEASGGTAIGPMTSAWRAGRQNCGCVGDNFVGSLDELAIYNEALDATRVLEHYTAAGR